MTHDDYHHQTSRLKAAHLLVLVAIAFINACDNYEVIMEDLAQQEANVALVLLRNKNINAKKEAHTQRKTMVYNIKVKKNQAEDALRLLVYNRLPRVDRAGLKEIYPPGSSGLIPTKSDELARLMMATQGEIEALLKVIPGIADARVVFSIDAPLDFHHRQGKKTASVALIYRAQKDNFGSPLSDVEVKNLISASIGGLLAEDVTVVQKAMAPLEYVDDQNLAETPTIDVKKDDEEKNFRWYLISLTILALLVATYGVFRLFIERRAAA